MSEFDLRVISLGAGVQSTTMYLRADRGDFPVKPEIAIFADTKCEPPWVYENLNLLREIGSIPIEVATAGNLQTAVETGINSTGGHFAAVPFWVRGEDGRETPGRRQCTREYKIDVVKRKIRELLGLRPGQRAAGRFHVEEWVGISIDEAQRAKPSRYDWIQTRHPLLFDIPMNRQDCELYLDRIGYPIVEKSACTFCPYRQTIEYARWREKRPEQFEAACKVDDLIRSKGTKGEQYVSRLLIPLREIPTVEELEQRDDSQLDLFGNECEGMCGV